MKPEGQTETVTAERAAEAVQRLINSHFHNDNRAHCSIPANLDDDDLVASRYVRQSSEQIAALQQANERMESALDRIAAWCKAYPLECIPEPDLEADRKLLGNSEFSRLNVHSMRHVVNGIAKIIADALAEAEEETE